jgi:hypothetical protein
MSFCNFVVVVIYIKTECEALRCVIPLVCVTNGTEESVVNQHNLFRKVL